MRQFIEIILVPLAFFLSDLFLYTAFRSYDIIPYLDFFTHFFGGFAVSYSAFLFFRLLEKRGYVRAHRFVGILFMVSLVVVVAVFWEFHEFLRDIIFDEHTQLSQWDTMHDLFLGMMGGFFGSIIFTRKLRNGSA